MSKTVIDKSSILLGSGDVFVLDASSENYGNHQAISTKSNLLCKMDNVRIHIKKTDTVTKTLVEGMIMDDEIFTSKMEFFFEFIAYEHTTKTQAIIFGGSLTDAAQGLAALMARPKNIRFEVKFTYPDKSKVMWYILPKCKSVSDFDFSPGNTDGATMKAIFRALPAVNENAIWYTTTTPCFNSYIV